MLNNIVGLPWSLWDYRLCSSGLCFLRCSLFSVELGQAMPKQGADIVEFPLDLWDYRLCSTGLYSMLPALFWVESSWTGPCSV